MCVFSPGFGTWREHRADSRLGESMRLVGSSVGCMVLQKRGLEWTQRRGDISLFHIQNHIHRCSE